MAYKFDILSKTHKSSFANKSTNSLGKTTSESYEDKIIGPILRRLNKNSPTHCAILVGHPSGLLRHIIRYRKMGFQDANIVVFEWCPKLAAKLRRFVQLKGLKCQVIEGDLIAGVERLAAIGHKFSCVEFDSVEMFGRAEPRVFSLVKHLNIPVVVTQGSARGQSLAFKEYLREKGHRQSWCKQNKRLSFSLNEKAPVYVKNKLSGYASWFKTYGGLNNFPMYMSVSIAKGV